MPGVEPTPLFRKHVFTGVAKGPRLLITAGVHGDEFEPMVAVRQLVDALTDAPFRGEVTLVPVVNESAFTRGKRAGADDLDLARTCPGRPDGSVTERVAHEVSALIRGAEFLVDLHTGGMGLAVYPLAGYMLHENRDVLGVQRRMAGAFGLPLVWGTSAALSGRTLSVARDANVPAIYVEHGGGSYVAGRVRDLVAGCLNVMVELAMIDRHAPPATGPKYVVEDFRGGSGQLQLNYPAPASGLFSTDRALGDIVDAGDEIGVLVDVLSGSRVHVKAETAGLLIMLRVWAQVSAGDALATIVELEKAP